MKKNTFRLSPAGKLAAAIAIISVSVATCYASGIISAGDPAHRPDVSAVNNVPVINIVTPSASGLSHNQFKEFNVGGMGAVLNNATSAGKSELAGHLAANPNLNGHAANIILNEVISRNPSLLLGQQEVFGMTADYILANPNGITCNGCGFINTNRASLVVGDPLIERGALKGFETFNNNSLLKIQDRGLVANRILDLVAPRIEVTGTVISTEAINALSGNNRVAADGKILESRQEERTPDLGSWFSQLFSASDEGTIDGKYLGSMQSGRINLVSTREGSGVKIAGDLQGREGIDASISGKLQLQAAQLAANDINIKAGSLDAFGHVHENKTNGDTTQTLEQTQLTGKNITLIANKKNHLSAVKIDGENVIVTGGELVLDGQKITQSQTSSYDEGGGWWLSKWSKEFNTKNTQEEQVGTKITASNSALFQATEGVADLSAADISAEKKLLINAKTEIRLDGLVEKNVNREWGSHTTATNDRSWDNHTDTEDLKKTTLTSKGQLALTAGGNIISKGVQVHAKEQLLVQSDQQVNIDVQKTANGKTVKDNATEWFGIGGKDKTDNNKNQEISHASVFTAEGEILIHGNKGASITGSKVIGQKGGVIKTPDGGLTVDNAISTTTDKVDERVGVAFDITGSSKKANNSTESSTGSELISETNLKIVAKDDVNVVGSQVKASDELSIQTEGELKVTAAQEKQKIDEQKTKLTIDGFTRDDGNDQYKAGLKLEHTSENEKTEHIKNQQASLEGGTVKLDAAKDVTFTGSQLNTTQGNADISAENVSFVAAHDTTTSSKEKETVGGDFHYTGGMDKAGSGAGVHYEKTKTDSNKSQAVTSGSQVAGDLNINASQDVTNQGSKHSVDGAYNVNAASVNNLAAENSEKTTTHTTTVDVGYGANVAYDEVTRPIEKGVNNAKDINIGGVIEASSEIGSPNIGLDLHAHGGTKETTVKETQSVGTTIKGGSITINADGKIHDQGTDYQADKGAINLHAATHTLEATVNHREEHTTEVSGGADVRIYTTTGKDINVNGKGQGSNKTQDAKSDTAQAGSMKAANGININVKDDATYQGTLFDAGKGKVTVTAGGKIHVDQATDHTSESHNNIDANAKASFGTDANSKEFGAELGGGHSKGESHTSTAHVSNMQGEQGVALNAGKDLTLTGTSFGSKDKPTGDVLLVAGGKVDIQTAKNESSKRDMTWSASASAGISKSEKTDKNSKGIKTKGEIKVAHTDESATLNQGSIIHSNGKFTVQAGSDDKQAIHLQNVDITSKETVLTVNDGAGILMESAQDKEHKNNWSFTAGANASQKTSVKKDENGVIDQDSADKIHDIGAKLDVAVDKLDSVTQQNTHINSDSLTLNGKNITLAGANIETHHLNGDIGNLKIESRENELHKVKIDISLGASHSNGKQDSLIDQVANASPIGSDKIKTKLEEKSTSLFDKVKKRYDAFADKHGTKKEDNVYTLSYTKEGEKLTLSESKNEDKTEEKWWQKGANYLGGKVKDKVQNAQTVGGNGHAKVSVEVEEMQGVKAQSSITVKQGGHLHVKDKTELVGGQIIDESGTLDFTTNELETQDIKGSHTEGGARLKGSSSVIDMLKDGVNDLTEGKLPLIGGHGKYEDKTVHGGVIKGGQ